jgi:dinuclear metal center YbgI/SA1388 family protein
MKTTSFVELMQSLAPLELAESWDNVGVLVNRGTRLDVRRVLLTIDLTEDVLSEAITYDVDAIVAYHPPIFGGVKRIVPTDPKGRLLGELLARDILVYSPHTALDSVTGGVNDWLADAFDTTTRRPITPQPGGAPLEPAAPNTSAAGQGRIVELTAPIHLDTAVARVKSHLGLGMVRRSVGVERTPGVANSIRSVAVCAGAGGGLLAKCRADLLVTGEMRHHDVLDLQQLGTSVILTDHTNCERGYLPVLRERIGTATLDVEVFVSTRDADPLQGV